MAYNTVKGANQVLNVTETILLHVRQGHILLYMLSIPNKKNYYTKKTIKKFYF